MILIHYDIKMSGESKTYPHIRTTPFSEKIDNLYKMMVGGFLTAAADPTSTGRAEGEKTPLNPGTMAMIVGNQKTALRRKLLAPWKEMTKKKDKKSAESEDEDDLIDAALEAEEVEDSGEARPSVSKSQAQDEHPPTMVREVTITKEEASMRARRTLARGTAILPQTEMLYLVHPGALNLPERQCAFGGTNRGTVLGPVKTPTLDSEWKMTVKEVIFDFCFCTA